jgi:hypothetical protein
MSKKKWEKIEQASDAIQAEVLRGFLEAQGFVVHISSEGYQTAIGITGYPLANIQILVPEDQAKEAKQTLKDYYAGKFEVGE